MFRWQICGLSGLVLLYWPCLLVICKQSLMVERMTSHYPRPALEPLYYQKNMSYEKFEVNMDIAPKFGSKGFSFS